MAILFALLVVFTVVSCNGGTQAPKEYVVTFESEGGTPVASVTVTEGQKVKQPTAPTKDGYYFGGWWTKTAKGNYKARYIFSKQVKEDLTLYARWYTTNYYMPCNTFSSKALQCPGRMM